MSDAFELREGTVYVHYKGGEYTVVAVAVDATNAADGTKVVVYRAHADGAVYVRNKNEFLQTVIWPDGVQRPRFVPAKPR